MDNFFWTKLACSFILFTSVSPRREKWLKKIWG